MVSSYSLSRKTPHPWSTDAGPRGIKFPISPGADGREAAARVSETDGRLLPLHGHQARPALRAVALGGAVTLEVREPPREGRFHQHRHEDRVPRSRPARRGTEDHRRLRVRAVRVGQQFSQRAVDSQTDLRPAPEDLHRGAATFEEGPPQRAGRDGPEALGAETEEMTAAGGLEASRKDDQV